MIPPLTFSLSSLLNQITPEIVRILDQALNDDEISVADAITLFAATGQDVWALAATANELRRRQVGDRVTYVQTRNINFTNVCYTGCKS